MGRGRWEGVGGEWGGGRWRDREGVGGEIGRE